MNRKINKVAVLGSGVMGSRIACHFANIGVEVLLLDIVPKEAVASKDSVARNKIVDDALKFATREVKRGKKYNGIIMDPPAFGIGAKKERWKIENKFPELVKVASQLLNKMDF